MVKITGDQSLSGEQAKKVTSILPTSRSMHFSPQTIQFLEIQNEYLPGFQKAYQDSRKDGLATEMTPAFEAIGKLSDKRFLVIHVSDYFATRCQSF